MTGQFREVCENHIDVKTPLRKSMHLIQLIKIGLVVKTSCHKIDFHELSAK